MRRRRTLIWQQGQRIPEIKMIQDALEAEGKMVDGQCIVPDDFFTRLNAKLNERKGPSILDRLLRNEEDCDDCSD